ncbi:carbohydrate binding family 9 domain-containing protein [Gemmatimonadota bacterium]
MSMTSQGFASGFPRSHILSLVVALVALTVFPASAFAQVRQSGSGNGVGLPTIRAERLTGSIDMDGRLDEAAWRTATPATEFTQLDPLEGEPASELTEVWVLYDDDAVYIGARLHDSQEPSTRLGRRDGFLMDSDWFSVLLDSYNDNRTAFQFQVNPSGVRSDEVMSGGGGPAR